MAFESNDFYVAKKTRLQKKQFNVDCNIPVEGDVSKIFNISSEVLIQDKEILDGLINYSGIVETCVIYMTENGEIGSTHVSCPFSSRIEDAAVKEGKKTLIFTKVLDYDVKDVTNGNLPITFLIEQTGFVVSNEEVKSITSSGEEIITKEEEMKVISFIGDCKKRIETQNPLQTREKIKKLLLCESQASIKDVESGTNYVSVSGEVVSRVLYLTETDKFESQYVFSNFKEEVEFDGVTKETKTEAFAFVVFPEVRASVDNQEKGANIVVTVPVDINIFAYNEVDVSVVTDLYSTTNEVEVMTESFEMTQNLPFEIIDSKISGSVIVDEDKPRVDKVLFNGGNSVSLVNILQEGDKVKIDGIAKTNVVYLNDEEGSMNSVEIEIPFSIEEEYQLREGIEFEAYALISDVEIGVKRGREIEYQANVKVILYADAPEISAVISSIEMKEALPEKDYAMEIIFGKENQSLWEISKQNKVKQELITKQNPDVVFPLANNTELVVFYKNDNK